MPINFLFQLMLGCMVVPSPYWNGRSLGVLGRTSDKCTALFLLTSNAVDPDMRSSRIVLSPKSYGIVVAAVPKTKDMNGMA